jgi:hypothetical protein
MTAKDNGRYVKKGRKRKKGNRGTKVTKGSDGIQDNKRCVSFSGDKLRHIHTEQRREKKKK